MYVLKKSKSKVVIKSLGIVLTKDSTQTQIMAAIKRVPAVANFFDNLKDNKNDRQKDTTGKK